ncbi:MAG: acyl-CoA reductase [Dehalococcoidales bacterium]|nr:acyl-CoA reductase [Dehalococcoidales bacterium]
MENNSMLTIEDGIIRIPFLVKGKLIIPPQIDRKQIEMAFGYSDTDTSYVKLTGAQVIREPLIDRKNMKYTEDYIYQLMPEIPAEALIENDIDKLADALYSLPVDEILDYLDKILDYLCKNRKLVSQAAGLYGKTSEYPDTMLDKWFASMTEILNRKAARRMIDAELSYNDKPGSDFLNGWVKVEGETACIRAMPTRQLHITAGNVPEVPIISALRAVLTKSAAVIKLPGGAIIPGALVAIATHEAAPDHPLTQNLSLVYWHGGDENIENILFAPGAFDRIIVWGGPAAIAAVQSKTPFTKTISLNPRYGVSLIGSEAFSGKLQDTVDRALTDVLAYNQKACISSLLHYVEGTEEQANEYAVALQQALKRYGDKTPNFTSPEASGQVKRMKRGRYANAKWYLNYDNEAFVSGAVVISGEFDILDHPTSQLVVVRPVAKLDDALKYIHQNVSTVGVYPKERRLELKDRILARGVSSVLPLGQCERVFAGMPHDGMMILNQLVDWKVG